MAGASKLSGAVWIASFLYFAVSILFLISFFSSLAFPSHAFVLSACLCFCLLRIIAAPWIEKASIVFFGIAIPWLLGGFTTPIEFFAHIFIGLGITSIAIWWYKEVWRNKCQNTLATETLFWWMIIFFSLVFASYVVFFISGLSFNQATYDYPFYTFDLRFDHNLPALIGQWMAESPPFRGANIIAYNTLPAAFLLALHEQLTLKKAPAIHVMHSFVIATFFIVLYMLAPACGPRQVFGALFPSSMPTSDYGHFMQDLSPFLARNAMPSLHTLWALLLWVHALYYYQWFLKLLFSATLFFTITSTMGLGEHYLIDLVVALPLLPVVQALAASSLSFKRPERWQAIVGGMTLMVVWLLAVCNALDWFDMFRAWAAIVGTCVITAILLYRLMKAANADIKGRARLTA